MPLLQPVGYCSKLVVDVVHRVYNCLGLLVASFFLEVCMVPSNILKSSSQRWTIQAIPAPKFLGPIFEVHSVLLSIRSFLSLWCYPRATAKCSMFYESFGQLCSKIQNRASHVFSCDFVSWSLYLRASTYNESSLKLYINICIWNYMYFSF